MRAFADGALTTTTANAANGARRRALWTGLVAGLGIVATVVIGAILLPTLLRRSDPIAVSRTIRSIAVLPLDNLSGDPAQDYFADGMTDELIATLGGLGSVNVISRTSVQRYKGSTERVSDICRTLNVDAVIRGDSGVDSRRRRRQSVGGDGSCPDQRSSDSGRRRYAGLGTEL